MLMTCKFVTASTFLIFFAVFLPSPTLAELFADAEDSKVRQAIKNTQQFNGHLQLHLGHCVQDIYEGGKEDQKTYRRDLFQGDIILNDDQINKLSKIMMPNKTGDSLKTNDLIKRWGMEIPYMVQDSENEALVEDSIKDIEKHTCLKFKKISSPQGDYLNFINGKGCWSWLGHQGGKQDISMGNDCKLQGMISNEIMHAIGYLHPHSNIDRDTKLNIRFDNIKKGAHHIYQVVPLIDSNPHQLPFNFLSVMNYDTNEFSITPRSPVTYAIDDEYRNSIGSRKMLSFLDIKTIYLDYCQTACPTKIDCENGGFQDTKNCNQCVCPTHFSGSKCEHLETGEECGPSTIHLDENNPKFEFDKEGNYKCMWKITAPKGRKIEIDLKRSWFYCADESGACKKTYWTVNYFERMDYPAAINCCNFVRKMVSKTNWAFFGFNIETYKIIVSFTLV